MYELWVATKFIGNACRVVAACFSPTTRPMRCNLEVKVGGTCIRFTRFPYNSINHVQVGRSGDRFCSDVTRVGCGPNQLFSTHLNNAPGGPKSIHKETHTFPHETNIFHQETNIPTRKPRTQDIWKQHEEKNTTRTQSADASRPIIHWSVYALMLPRSAANCL